MTVALLRRTTLAFLLFISLAAASRAGTISGTVTDSSGARIIGATVALLQNSKVVSSARSDSNGNYQILTGTAGRFFIVVSAPSFRQLETPTFYSGQFDSLERNLVLEPAWVRQSVVVTATGTPTPQPQTGAATSVLTAADIANRVDLVNSLSLMPGAITVQAGQRGAQTSLFIRGGDSDDNKVLIDGISAGDIGGRFDFGPLPTTALERAEIYRGANSGLYGAGAESGVVSLVTPRGTTSFPSIFVQADAGNFYTSHEEATLAGTYNRLDYLGTYSWFQTANDLPNDTFHLGSAAGNFGWQPNGTTQLRGTVHYNVSGEGVPNAWNFYHVADDATQKDQDLYISASFDNQTTASFHNTVRYGATRKREQYALWQPSGQLINDYDGFGDNAYFGNVVTINGANGTSATGQAILDYQEPYPYTYQLVSNRDQLLYQGDYKFTPHLLALIGFHFDDERGTEVVPNYSENESVSPTNYDYVAGINGDFKNRFYYTLGGSLLHYSLFGTYTTPRAGFSLYALKPRSGIFSGTRILFNYGDAIREPALTDETGSLYQFFVNNNLQSDAAALHIGPLAPPFMRVYEGGIEQTFLSEHILFRAEYFHNQFSRQIEYVGGRLIPNLIPGLTAAQQQQLIAALGTYYQYDYPLAINTEAFRAQGVEATVEGGIGHSIFLRGGYTYLDAAVQRSFDSDNEALTGGYAPTYNGIPIGAISPLVGARPFRRPPHTAFGTATFSASKLAAQLTGSYASRSDDSTYLEDEDQYGGNSLLLPNRNLDHGYIRLDLGGSYQLIRWLTIYAQAENLVNDQHMAPIGYPSLPFNVRAGLRFQWGRATAH